MKKLGCQIILIIIIGLGIYYKPDPGMKTLNTKHIIATGTGKMGIAARIDELVTTNVGSILLLLLSMLNQTE